MKYSKEQPLIEDIQNSVNTALFGTEHIGKSYALFMVAVSIFGAMFIPHSGFFPTSQSEGMTNYHRWLYDQFVIVSCLMGILVYLLLKHKKRDLKFRPIWNSYTKFHAEHRFRNYQYEKEQGKTTILYSSKIIHYLVLWGIIIGCIAMYIWMTPFAGTYKSSFWILTWWPINALIIWALYCSQISVFLQAFAISEMDKNFQRMKRKAERRSKSRLEQESADRE